MMRGRSRARPVVRMGPSGPVDTGQASVPTITGTRTVGQTLTLVFADDDPDGAATNILYQWTRNGVNIGGETSDEYLLVSDDIGQDIKGKVTYTDPLGKTKTLTSASAGTIDDAPPVVPDVQTFDSSGAFVVPSYNTLEIEMWGAGGGSAACTNISGTPTIDLGANGGDTTIASLGLTAGGGARSTGGAFTAGGRTGDVGAGGIASGGDINTNGNSGTRGTAAAGSSSVGGAGAASPNGGASRTGPTDTTFTSPGIDGNAGNAPGGGASGGANVTSGASEGGDGAGSGAYLKITFINGDIGAPNIGDTLDYVVGVGGVAGVYTGINPNHCNGAAGANGRVKITIS